MYKKIGCFDKTIGCFSLSLKNTFLLKRLRMPILWIRSRVNYKTQYTQILSKTAQQQQAQPSLQHPSKGLDSSNLEHHLVQQYCLLESPCLTSYRLTLVSLRWMTSLLEQFPGQIFSFSRVWTLNFNNSISPNFFDNP